MTQVLSALRDTGIAGAVALTISALVSIFSGSRRPTPPEPRVYRGERQLSAGCGR